MTEHKTRIDIQDSLSTTLCLPLCFLSIRDYLNALPGIYWFYVPARFTWEEKQSTHRVAPASLIGVAPSLGKATPIPAIAFNFADTAEIKLPSPSCNLGRPSVL